MKNITIVCALGVGLLMCGSVQADSTKDFIADCRSNGLKAGVCSTVISSMMKGVNIGYVAALQEEGKDIPACIKMPQGSYSLQAMAIPDLMEKVFSAIDNHPEWQEQEFLPSLFSAVAEIAPCK